MKLFCQRITLVFTSEGTCSQSKYTRFQNTGYCWHYKNCIDFYVSVLQVFACKTCNPLFLHEISWLGTVCPHVMFTFKSIPVKSISVFFPFIVYHRRYSRNTVYSMIEQKKFYSFVTVNKISMKHTRAFWTKKQRQKAQIKREGTKKSTTFLYLISAIFRVRPHVFININQLCVNYSIVCLLSAEIYCFRTDIIAEEVFRLYLRFEYCFCHCGMLCVNIRK